MSENPTEEPADDSDSDSDFDSEDSDSDSENQDSTARTMVHVFVLGLLAVVVAVIANTRSHPGTMLPLDGLVGKGLWIMFAVYSTISSLGYLVWNSWSGLVGVHVVAGVLAYPASIPVFMLVFG